MAGQAPGKHCVSLFTIGVIGRQPLYRQSAILERETAMELSRATLDGWVMRFGELLRPISGAMAQELLSGDYIQVDETPVDVESERTKRQKLPSLPQATLLGRRSLATVLVPKIVDPNY